MPEAPDLEVIKEFLNREVQGQVVEGAKVIRPTVIRSIAGDFASDIQGRTFGPFQRKGKFLLGELSGDRCLVINPMLTGALQYCEPKVRVLKKTCFTLGLTGGAELRYLDDRQMGLVYYVTEAQMPEVPRLEDQGADVLSGISLEEFRSRLTRFHGEIKGVLTRGRVVSGIGNAYADEVLFAAKIYPFRKRGSLTEEGAEVNGSAELLKPTQIAGNRRVHELTNDVSDREVQLLGTRGGLGRHYERKVNELT